MPLQNDFIEPRWTASDCSALFLTSSPYQPFGYQPYGYQSVGEWKKESIFNIFIIYYVLIFLKFIFLTSSSTTQQMLIHSAPISGLYFWKKSS
jgi:hypothetical protein